MLKTSLCCQITVEFSSLRLFEMNFMDTKEDMKIFAIRSIWVTGKLCLYSDCTDLSNPHLQNRSRFLKMSCFWVCKLLSKRLIGETQECVKFHIHKCLCYYHASFWWITSSFSSLNHFVRKELSFVMISYNVILIST